jgi:hypothetical protein
MKLTIQRKFWLSLLLAGPGVVALALYGIASFSEGSSATSSFARFTPSEESARNALEAALRSWQLRNPPGKVAGSNSPEVMLVDTCRRPGQTVEHFTILGEAAGDGPRCFAVRVCLSNPDEEQHLRFVVFGVDPLWVYRCEDYEMMIRWECGREERNRKAASQKTIGE